MPGCCFIQVILPLRLEWVPWYSSPKALAPGTRVSVVFARRSYVGVVLQCTETPGLDETKIQSVTRICDELPAVSAEELAFWDFLSGYYLCSIGEVYKTACPAGKIKGEQKAASILERLHQRLAVREEALTKKHRDNVRERLEAERDKIRRQIDELTRIPCPVTSGKTSRPPKPVLFAGAGRPEHYLELCRDVLSQGRNVLVLTPEIAMGDLLEGMFEKAFPGQVHSVNSHISEARRRRVAEDLRSFGGQVVIGARSALFLPFSRLGLIIVDNEQDPFYKQSEHNPRYNARDAAVMLGRIHGCPVVLGSPSPSLESYYNAVSGKYELQKAVQPSARMTVIDVSEEKHKNGMVGHFSRKLLKAAALSGGPVALIRGWEKPDELLGQAAELFKDIQADIYTPAQARLSDLGGYSLVAILQADALFSDDGFRSDERAVQTLAMLREQCRGTFIVQTAKQEHPVFRSFEDIYPRLLEERRSFALPPYTRLVDTDFGGRKERLVLTPDGSLTKKKQELRARALDFEKKAGGRVRVIIDVDPI
ncbi:MAG: hypothetical protein IJU68_02165 [Bacteroidales bacterium]|nr:hypothetical protein [Bacteroidales bacterium]